MPKLEYDRATYVKHAHGYTIRPTINGKRYFIGYWERENDAIKRANEFKRWASYAPQYQGATEQDIADRARELQAEARAENDGRRRQRRTEPSERKLPLPTRMDAVELRLRNLEEMVREMQQ